MRSNAGDDLFDVRHGGRCVPADGAIDDDAVLALAEHSLAQRTRALGTRALATV
jgi:hypothetical protein